MEDVPVIFKRNDLQSFGKTLVDLYRHEFCITKSYFQNLHKMLGDKLEILLSVYIISLEMG